MQQSSFHNGRGLHLPGGAIASCHTGSAQLKVGTYALYFGCCTAFRAFDLGQHHASASPSSELDKGNLDAHCPRQKGFPLTFISISCLFATPMRTLPTLV